MAKDITSDEIINKYHEAQPRFLWKIDCFTFDQVKYLKNANGEYLWAPNLEYKKKPGTLLGIEIVLNKSPERCIELVVFFDSNIEIHQSKRDD